MAETKESLKSLFSAGQELTEENFAKLIDAFALFLETEVGVETDKSLTLTSTDEGGLNTFDSTNRLVTQSFQKAQRTNSSGEPAHYGETVRLEINHEQAKNVIAFQKAYGLTDGEVPKTVAWLVAHGKANDSTEENPKWHNHFSIELPDTDGMLQTVMEFPFAEIDEPNGYGIPMDRMQARTTNKLVAGNLGMWVENPPGAEKTIKFSSGKYAKEADRRWAIGADNTAETGTQAGSDFRITRYKDNGDFISTPFFIKRSNGLVGINTNSPTRPLDIDGNTLRLRQSMTPTGADAYGESGCIRWDTENLYLHTGEVWKKIPLQTIE